MQAVVEAAIEAAIEAMIETRIGAMPWMQVRLRCGL